MARQKIAAEKRRDAAAAKERECQQKINEANAASFRVMDKLREKELEIAKRNTDLATTAYMRAEDSLIRELTDVLAGKAKKTHAEYTARVLVRRITHLITLREEVLAAEAKQKAAQDARDRVSGMLILKRIFEDDMEQDD